MVDVKKASGPRPETLAKRRAILAAATDVFGSKGYANGTLAEIADQVGMTHAGILHHFGSKDQLLLEVLTYRDESDVDHLDGRHIPGGAELFRHLVRTAELNENRAGIVQAFAVLSGESVTDGHPAQQYFIERYDRLREDIASAFREVCAQRGVSEPALIDSGAAAIVAVMDGLQVQWLLSPGAIELARTTRFAIEAIVSAVLDHTPAGIDPSV
ncbi:TetR/AcrR family transcriptional regulator [Microbacterium gorillae]|uniref:TetR/AcrR family transcriptional regulator n=1 Tax=Microbacterium gorillae TaxID=1231063 RepID=UPI0005913119|nr:TetR/AcrR family transcriptional regulator [Microbacterium gorillae]